MYIAHVFVTNLDFSAMERNATGNAMERNATGFNSEET